MMKKIKAEDQVYVFLKEQIGQGFYPEKMKLNEEDLASKLSVSRSPVRSALRRLANEGLIMILPNKGAYVSQQAFSKKEVIDRLEMFELLMSQTLLVMEKWRLSFSEFPEKLLKQPYQEQKKGLIEWVDTLKESQKNTFLLKTLKGICYDLVDKPYEVMNVTQSHMCQSLVMFFYEAHQRVTQKDYAGARKIVRLFVNDLSLSIIDEQEIKQRKY